jgi:hypothetical protein
VLPLPDASPGDDQERARDIGAKAGNAVHDRAALFGIETLLPTKRFTSAEVFRAAVFTLRGNLFRWSGRTCGDRASANLLRVSPVGCECY